MKLDRIAQSLLAALTLCHQIKAIASTATKDGTVYVYSSIVVATERVTSEVTITHTDLPDWCVPTVLKSITDEVIPTESNIVITTASDIVRTSVIPNPNRTSEAVITSKSVYTTVIPTNRSILTSTESNTVESVSTSTTQEVSTTSTASPTSTIQPSPFPPGFQVLYDQSQFAQDILYWTNLYRQLTGAGPLVWNDTLAELAGQYATECVFEHSKLSYGENLALGTYTNPAYYVYAWFNEFRQYDFNFPQFDTATGHFTQLVWKDTAQVGCAYVQGCYNLIYNDPYYLACEYTPQGNIITNTDQGTADIFNAQVGRVDTDNIPQPAASFDAFKAWL